MAIAKAQPLLYNCSMKLPFAMDRALNSPLTEQMFQGLKNAIVRGVYKPGDSLP